jgi:hypothetical protein
MAITENAHEVALLTPKNDTFGIKVFNFASLLAPHLHSENRLNFIVQKGECFQCLEVMSTHQDIRE